MRLPHKAFVCFFGISYQVSNLVFPIIHLRFITIGDLFQPLAVQLAVRLHPRNQSILGTDLTSVV